MPFSHQLILDAVAPPILAFVWFIFSRGWAQAVQGVEVSERTKKRQVRGFFVVLALLYIVMVTATLYLHFHSAG